MGTRVVVLLCMRSTLETLDIWVSIYHGGKLSEPSFFPTEVVDLLPSFSVTQKNSWTFLLEKTKCGQVGKGDNKKKSDPKVTCAAFY